VIPEQEPFARWVVSRLMAELAIHPPVHLNTHPDEPVRSLEAAIKVVQRHAGVPMDRATEGLLHRLETAASPQQADEAGDAFRAWAEAHGLLLVPPEDA
jgi:hypothetical protein